MTWILIFCFVSWQDGGGMISQEFNSKDACDFAQAEIVKLTTAQHWTKTIVTCVPKGRVEQ